MKIRQEQMDSLGAMREDDLVEAAAEHLRRAYPELTFRRAPEEIDALVRGFFAEAGRFGLTGAYAVMRYVAYRAEIGERLVSAPDWAWAREILADASLGDDARIARMDELVYGGSLAADEED